MPMLLNIPSAYVDNNGEIINNANPKMNKDYIIGFHNQFWIIRFFLEARMFYVIILNSIKKRTYKIQLIK